MKSRVSTFLLLTALLLAQLPALQAAAPAQPAEVHILGITPKMDALGAPALIIE